MPGSKKIEILKKVWGFESFRSIQEDIIDSILSKKDTLGLMATGGGKSLCYQLPALILEGLCVVISPLIALMEDQERGLTERGIKVLSIHSGKRFKEQDALFDNAVYGDYKFIFMSPEKLQSPIAQERLKKMNISFFTIDEAHCISQWGHDFRPSYLNLTILKEQFPGTPILALTATATPRVIKDIVTYLEFDKNFKIFKTSFSRPNISISVMHGTRKLDKVLKICKSIKGSKIIYTRNKRHCFEINQYLKKSGIKSDLYHADLSYDERKKRQHSWQLDDTEVMVSTSAFGMGIDKPDVRLVMHYDVPSSLEEYIQEIGRAGRDGEHSYAVMIVNNYDLQELEFHHNNGRPELKEIKEFYNELALLLKIPLGEGGGIGYRFDFESLMRKCNTNRVKLKSVLQILEKNGYLFLSDGAYNQTKLQIIGGREILNGFIHANHDLAQLTNLLLRSYEGLFYSMIPISIQRLMGKLNWSEDKVMKVLASGVKQEIFKLDLEGEENQLTLIHDRLPKDNILIDQASLKEFYKSKQIHYEGMMDFISERRCRSVQILEYFDEEKIEKCGICDYCMGAFEKNYSQKEFNKAHELVLEKLNANNKVQLEDLLDIWPWNKQEKLKEILKFMIEQEMIWFKNGYFSLSVKA